MSSNDHKPLIDSGAANLLEPHAVMVSVLVISVTSDSANDSKRCFVNKNPFAAGRVTFSKYRYASSLPYQAIAGVSQAGSIRHLDN